MWFRQPENLFQCPAVIHPDSATNVTFLRVWAKIILPCFLQSAGTAIGEIPPYWMARSARIAAMEAEHLHLFSDEDSNALPEELEATSNYSIVNYLKEQMILFLHKYGFYGVLLMASYPNLAFDLCGVCCGHFLMPFFTFFIATFLGKAVVRNSYQSFFYVFLCSEEYLERIIRVIQQLLPDSWDLDNAIRDILEQGRESFQRKMHESQQQGSLEGQQNTEAFQGEQQQPHPHQQSVLSEQLMTLWQLTMTIILTTFFLSCLAEFAQCYQRVLDDQDAKVLRERVPLHIVEQIASPTSGRWHLPAPTPLKALRKVRKSLSPVPSLPPLSTPKKLRTPMVSFASDVKSPSAAKSTAFTFPSSHSAESEPVPLLRLPSDSKTKSAIDSTNQHELDNVATIKTNKVLFASPTSDARNSPEQSSLRQRQKSSA
jgi:membrane protein YqaA with SNARE-associated domain